VDVVLSSSRDATFGSMIFNFTLFFILFQFVFLQFAQLLFRSGVSAR